MALRALRRYHSRRMKAKAKRIYPWWPKNYKAADQLQICSCTMCCNPRHSCWNSGTNKLTWQERNALLLYREGLDE